MDKEKWEKVIKGLECCGKGNRYECNNCGYLCEDNCYSALCDDVLALLKEQEPVEVKIEQDTYPDETLKGPALYYCGNCGDDIADGQKFCANCGKPVKWNA